MTLARLQKRFIKIFSRGNWEILRELFRANLLVWDHNAIFGSVWSIFNPLVFLAVMYLVFHERFGLGIKAYPLHLFIGIVSVNFFVSATGYALGSFRSSRETLMNLLLPRETFLLANLLNQVYKLLIELALCGLCCSYWGLFSLRSLVLLPPLILSFVLFTLGVIFVLSTLFCFARDVAHLWSMISRVLYFATPIFYSISQAAPFARRILLWGNPLTSFMTSLQSIFLQRGQVVASYYLYSLVLGVSVFWLGYAFFLSLERRALERA